MDIAADVAAGSAVLAAFAACWVAINSSRTLKREREDSRNSHRPMVAAYFEAIPYVEGCQRLVITNLGRSVARNLAVTFDPEIPHLTTEDPRRSTSYFLKQRYAKPIPVLVPGVVLQDPWFIREIAAPGEQYLNREPTPDRVTVHVSYEGPDGAPYNERFPLDVDLLRYETTFESSASPDGRAKALLAEIKKIATGVTSIAKNSQP